MKLQKTTTNHSNSEKEEKNLEVSCYCKTIVIKIGWYHQQQQKKPQNQTKTKTQAYSSTGKLERLEINQHLHDQVIYNNGYIMRETVFSINGTGKATTTSKRMKLDNFLQSVQSLSRV